MSMLIALAALTITTADAAPAIDAADTSACDDGIDEAVAARGGDSARSSASFDAPSDGVRLETLHDSGAPDNRVDIVIIGDGYTASEMDDYARSADKLVDALFNGGNFGAPYNRYPGLINIHRVDLVSAESGIDRYDNDGMTESVDTALNGYAPCGWSETSGRCVGRLGLIDTDLGAAALDWGLEGTDIEADWVIVLLNNDGYHNAGQGRFAIVSDGHSYYEDVALHEAAHSWHNLADEYQYNTDKTFTMSEPSQRNVTTDASGAKWSDWLGTSYFGLGTVGAYEGAKYADYGIYRPTSDSRMRSVTPKKHNIIAVESIILDIYDHVDTLVESHTDNNSLLVDPDIVEVEVTDPSVLNVTWYLGNLLIGSGETLDLEMSYLWIDAGEHELTAVVNDATSWVRADTDRMSTQITWTIEISEANSFGYDPGSWGSGDTCYYNCDNSDGNGWGG